MKTKTTIGVVLIVVSLVLFGLYYGGYIQVPDGGNGGNGGTTTTVGYPQGEIVKLNIKSPNNYFENTKADDIKVKVKNSGNAEGDFLVEVGIIPKKVAREWDMLNMLALGDNFGGQCCRGQENIEDKWVTIAPGETRTIDFSRDLKTPYSSIIDRCGNTNYWDGCVWNTWEDDYVVYAVMSNHCHYKEGEEQSGYVLYDQKTNSITLKCKLI